MDVSVMLEQVKGNGYRATALMPASLVAEAPTRNEAVEKIQSLLSEKFAGAELIQVTVPIGYTSNPWLAIAGTWSDHPDLDEVLENIQEYRREVDGDPNRL